MAKHKKRRKLTAEQIAADKRSTDQQRIKNGYFRFQLVKKR